MGNKVVKTLDNFRIKKLIFDVKKHLEASAKTIKRIVEKQKGVHNFQVAFIAMDKHGKFGEHTIHVGFSYMDFQSDIHQNIAA